VGALQVRHEPSSAALVRHQIIDDLRPRGIPSQSVEMIVLVASELVGNAVLHSTSAQSNVLQVNWDVDATGVTVCVADSSLQLPRRREAHDDEVGGRGLAIIDAVADAWGVDCGPTGKQVWAHVPVGSPSAHAAQPA
jgi:anti-sigma regulatory factor (Ser/Thr protein kinase)